MPPPGPQQLSQVTSQGPTITVYPADLFTSTNTPNPNVTAGGTGVNAAAGAVQTTASGGFYTQIQLVPGQDILTGLTGPGVGISSGVANPQTGSSIYLPLPWKINDIEMHLWNDLSFIDQMPVIEEGGKIISGVGRALGAGGVINPFQYMMYKQPAFRQFEFAWSFSPNNSSETQTLSKIINYLKTGALPEYGTGSLGGIVLQLPYIALVRINPNKYMFDFKPCAITSVAIDFSGSSQGPAFYNDGGPAIINFTLGLKEVEIQVRSDVAWRGGSLTAGMTSGAGAAGGAAVGGAAGAAVGGIGGGGAAGAAVGGATGGTG